MKNGLHVLILAAGKGTRFKSETIKVLHPLLGKSMIQIMADTVSRLRPEKIHMVVGHQKELVMQETFPREINFIHQKTQKGTAHAVISAKTSLQKYASDGDVLIINGDLPLIRTDTLRPLVKLHKRQQNALTFMTAEMDDPTGFGRVIHLDQNKIRIIEEKDATPAQRKIKEGNVGIYIFKIKELLLALPKISNKNKKGEYYLTDIIEILSSGGKKVGIHKTSYVEEIVGVNDRFELARAIDVLRLRLIKTLADKGVTFFDPSLTWIDFDVKIGSDTTIYPFVSLEGQTVIGKQCVIYPNVHIISSRIGNGVKILTSTMIEFSRIKQGAQVGPFSHLRPQSILEEGTKVGNFVEMKNAVFGRKSKANHLSYIGDSKVGEGVNIGAGTITCNYDGYKKHLTLIEDGVFIGSGVQLVAPVKVGRKAYVGAGSTITKNVSPESLAVARGRQIEKKGWARKRKKK